MKTCPRCQLPAAAIGRGIAASSADGERHGVVGVCVRCTSALSRLPRHARAFMLGPAIERALDDPARYVVRLYPDFGACQLAVGLLGHPEWAARTLEALGWLPEAD